MHVCMYPHFLLNWGSGLPSQACSLLMIKTHLFSLHWEFFSSVSSSASCLLIASLQLLERLRTPAVLIKSSPKSFWNVDVVEDIPSLQTSLQISTWVQWSPASAPLNPSIAVTSSNFKTKTHLAWCEVSDGVQQNPQCRCPHISVYLCAMDLNSHCSWWWCSHYGQWRVWISSHRCGQYRMANLSPAVTAGEQLVLCLLTPRRCLRECLKSQ